MAKNTKGYKFLGIICLILAVAICSCFLGYFVGNKFFPIETPTDSATVQEVDDLKAKVSDLRDMMLEYETNAGVMSAKITILNNKISDLETQIAALQQDSETNREKIQALTEERDNLIAERNTLQAQYDEIYSTIQTLTTQMSTLETRITQLENMSSIQVSSCSYTLSGEEISSNVIQGTFLCKRYGNVITLYITHMNLNVVIDAYATLTLATLPVEYRPSYHFSQSYSSMSGGAHYIDVSASTGIVTLNAWATEISTSDWHTLAITYVV